MVVVAGGGGGGAVVVVDTQSDQVEYVVDETGMVVVGFGGGGIDEVEEILDELQSPHEPPFEP